MTFQSVNPATGEVLETFEETTPDALTSILERADAASRDWRRRPVTERAERLRATGRLFRAVFLSNEGAGSAIADGRVRAVTLTGSDRAGSQVAEQAGRHLKKTVLELGGSDPFIVLEDADLERAATTAVEARLINSGQSCIAAKRFIVVERVADQFLELFTSEMR